MGRIENFTWGVGGGGDFLEQIRTKMEQEEWLQLKMQFLLGYNLEIVI